MDQNKHKSLSLSMTDKWDSSRMNSTEWRGTSWQCKSMSKHSQNNVSFESKIKNCLNTELRWLTFSDIWGSHHIRWSFGQSYISTLKQIGHTLKNFTINILVLALCVMRTDDDARRHFIYYLFIIITFSWVPWYTHPILICKRPVKMPSGGGRLREVVAYDSLDHTGSKFFLTRIW